MSEQDPDHQRSKCPKCRAPRGEPCTSGKWTGNYMHGRELDRVHYGRPEWSDKVSQRDEVPPLPHKARVSEPLSRPQWASSDLLIDLETYSRVDLKKYGMYRYAEDRDFRVLMAAWSTNGGANVRVETTIDGIARIPGLFDPGVRKVAHNAAFERVCLSRFAGFAPGRFLPPEQYHDTMAVAAEKGYPRGLDPLARALGAPPKDGAGTALIHWFCKPDRDGKRRLPEDHPDKWEQFKTYCAQDVRTLAAVHLDLGEMPTETERRVWLVDQKINDRGMLVDLDLAAAGVEASRSNSTEQAAELVGITGVDNANSLPQIAEWLRVDGAGLTNLRAETIQDALTTRDLTGDQRRVLELRQELALVAAKKFGTAIGSASFDSRLRGGFKFYGAHTGRWAGRGVQPHNLPRAALDGETAQQAAILDLMLGLGADAQTLKALVRAMFLGPLTVVDYAAIEARVISWLAGEEWALEAFRAGRDIYVETAERMGGLTRAQGKVAVLALGFSGWVNSLRVMGAVGTDAELEHQCQQWRRANPNVVQLWDHTARAFKTGGAASEHVTVEKDGNDRAVKLPSGRDLIYHNVSFVWEDTLYGRRERAMFDDPARPGTRLGTYGGRLTENMTQAVARDVLAEALVRVDAAGYVIVGHVHDEVLVEGTAVEEVTKLMTVPPTWAKGLPINAEGFACSRYRKG